MFCHTFLYSISTTRRWCIVVHGVQFGRTSLDPGQSWNTVTNSLSVLINSHPKPGPTYQVFFFLKVTSVFSVAKVQTWRMGYFSPGFHHSIKVFPPEAEQHPWRGQCWLWYGCLFWSWCWWSKLNWQSAAATVFNATNDCPYTWTTLLVKWQHPLLPCAAGCPQSTQSGLMVENCTQLKHKNSSWNW